MSEQQMPARIWIKPFTARSSDLDVKNAIISSLTGDTLDNVEFIRADIAERMAEALEESRLQIEYMRSVYDTGSGNIALSRIRAALSAFKDATGANHE